MFFILLLYSTSHIALSSESPEHKDDMVAGLAILCYCFLLLHPGSSRFTSSPMILLTARSARRFGNAPGWMDARAGHN